MTRLICLALLLAAWPAAGQEPPASPKPTKVAPAPQPQHAPHEIRLQSGTLLVGRIEPEIWKVETAFGELSVPIRELKRVRFGRRSNPARRQRVQALINDLGSEDPDLRNHAQGSLKREGAFGAPEIKHAGVKHADPEVRRMCEEILEALDIDEDAFIPESDRLETSLFSVTGRVTLDAFRVTVVELGVLNIRRSDIVSVRAYRRSDTRTFTVTGQNTMASGWVDTKIKVKKGVRFKITAEGTIHFPRWGNQMFTPDGNPQMGNINGIWMGALVGRVGSSGTLFRIGRSYSGIPAGTGTLQLCCMVNMTGQPATGEFTVRIQEIDS